jgi:nicotinate-nucleotide adenylyltransferase
MPKMKTMSSILLLGASFNPIHVGHLITSRAAAEILHIPDVVMVPCAPHKRSEYAPFRDRAEMVRRTIEPHTSHRKASGVAFDISYAEEGIEGRPSYTIDTVDIFRRAGFKDVFWLIGADNVKKATRWHRFEELREMVTFAVMPRPGYDLDPAYLAKMRHRIVDTPLINISSSDIRDRVKRGQSITYLVPPVVDEYIREHQLYLPQTPDPQQKLAFTCSSSDSL